MTNVSGIHVSVFKWLMQITYILSKGKGSQEFTFSCGYRWIKVFNISQEQKNKVRSEKKKKRAEKPKEIEPEKNASFDFGGLREEVSVSQTLKHRFA